MSNNNLRLVIAIVYSLIGIVLPVFFKETGTYYYVIAIVILTI